MRAVPAGPIRLGLRPNWRQFALLVAVNGFVGAMVGMERTVLPILGRQVFGIASEAAIVSFLVSFGIVKAVSNVAAGRLADLHGRKRILLIGWLVGIPVPFLLIFAPPPHWWVVVLANVFLGANQGLCWSITVLSKIDLVGPRSRGLATGLNEFAGYVAVGGTALLTGYLAGAYGVGPVPFLVGIVAVGSGLLLSAAWVKETKPYVGLEARPPGPPPSFRATFAEATWRDRRLFACSQGGLVNNLNDGVVWGLLPIFLFAPSRGLSEFEIGLVAGLYPLTWGIFQIATGAASDRVGRKPLLVAGMWVQAAAFLLFVVGKDLAAWSAASLLLGVGTALVYPTFLSAVSDLSRPDARGATVGVYRFWRDLGFAVGAIVVGLYADASGLDAAFLLTGALTFASGVLIAVAMVGPTARKP
ncbi:MAG TPA: MFS transporter [Thermoplasmata archaeon]|nr:MFS transporter [Thermoplasmata archaeon]